MAVSDSSSVETHEAPGRRLDLEILWSLRSIIQALDVHSRRLSSTSNVTFPQLLCLWAVEAEECVTAKDIAEKIHVSPSTLVGVLDRLEAKSLIERVRDPADRRRVHVQVTPEGARLTARASSPFGEAFDTAFSKLDAEEQLELARAAAQLGSLLQGHQEIPRR